MAAGAGAGLVLALWLLAVGERSIGDAITLEEQRAAARHQVHHDMFSRGVQHIGGAVGAVLFGVCVGVVFAVVYAAVRHRLPGPTDWHRAVQLAAAGFVTVFLVPFLKYPANPPAVGDPGTITRRTLLYGVVLAWSIVATAAAWRLATWLRRRSGAPATTPLRVPLVVAAWLAIVTLGYVALPGAPDPVRAPATLIWRFRLASAGGSGLFWCALGLAFGALVVRTPAAAGRRRQAATGKRQPGSGNRGD
jgi:predicted cobalt transporter CbtA